MHQRRTLRVLVGAQIFGGLGMGAGLAVGGLLAADLSGSTTLSGLSTTMITLGAALFALPLAHLALRAGRRISLGAGWLIAMTGAGLGVVAGVIGSFALLVIGMLLFGSGTASNLQSRYAATDLATPRTRARSLAIVVWSTSVGAIAGPNLTGAGATVADGLGLPVLTGPLVFAAAAFFAGGVLTLVALRPDPLLTSIRQAADEVGADRAPPPPQSLRIVSAIRAMPAEGRLALLAIVLSHAVMVMVMTMTPVHLHHGGVALSVVGLTISLHVAGMYALSPVAGWLADTIGRIPVIVLGQAILAASLVVSGLAGHSEPVVMVGLVLLGLGWCCATVAGSTLLAESVAPPDRPRVQGTSDLLMNLMGASGGATSGALLAIGGFSGLNLAAGLLIVPVLAMALHVRATRRLESVSVLAGRDAPEEQAPPPGPPVT